MTQTPLAGLSVMVLEDEPIIAMLTADLVTDLGGIVLGPFIHLKEAEAHVDQAASRPDLALLDINVHGVYSTDLAQRLINLNVPVVFCTGYDEAGIEEQWRATPRLQKPFSMRELATASRQALEQSVRA